MARIVTTTPKNKKRFLFKAGLSIFLFLQIQMPNVATGTLKKINSWSAEICRHHAKAYCVSKTDVQKHVALATALQK